MTETHLAVIITLITAIILIIIVCVAVVIGIISVWRETPKKKRKGLKCLAGIHKWRYVRLPSRDCYFTPKKIFTTSYYNKKVNYCVKYCLKCLKFKAEKV